MSYRSRILYVVLLSAIAMTGAAADPERTYQRATAICLHLQAPGIKELAGGEFWMREQARRAELSEQLWSKSGRRFLQQRIAENAAELRCLDQLRGEAKRRRIG